MAMERGLDFDGMGIYLRRYGRGLGR